MPAPYPSAAPVWPDQQQQQQQQLYSNARQHPHRAPHQHSRKADMQHHQQQPQPPPPQQQRHYDSSRSSPRHSPQHHRPSHQSPYSSQPNFSFLHASPSTTAPSSASPTLGRHHHAPSHPHITLQDLSYFSSQHPAVTAQHQQRGGGGESQQSLTLPPPPHHRAGAKSHSADITPYSSSGGGQSYMSSSSIHATQHPQQQQQQSPHAFPPSPTSSMRVHSPRNNNVVHLSAAALEFSPTLSSRPNSAQLAAVSGSPPSPHSARSTSSSSSSASSASSSAAVGQRRLSRASSNVSSGSPLAMTLQRNVSASSIVSTAMGSSNTSISHSSLTSSTSSIVSSASPTCTHSASSLAFPLHPCADYDTTWHLSVEQPAHLSYLLSFRTSVCPHFASPSSAMPCPHNGSTCFLSHSRLPRRRRPTLLNGRFNYLPTRCRYLPSSSSSDDADTLCPQSVHCRFAHCTEEVIYHPSKYKTQLCPHRLDEEGKCSGYGMHCAKAHGQADLRIGVYETRRCEGFPYNCQCDGFDWHREEERRRPPPILYAPIACPNVKPSAHAEWGHPALDCSGVYRAKVYEGGQWRAQRSEVWSCEYAHTLLELMYHPQVYHTGQCDKWDDKDVRRWRCVWKRRCAHAHGRVDARSKEEATEEWKEHIRQAVGHAAAPALIGRLTHPQGPQAAGNVAHAASAPLPISESDETDGRHTALGHPNAGSRQSVNGGHVRSVSQPVEMLGNLHYGNQYSAAVNLNASSPTHAHQMGMTLQARSHSQQMLQLPAQSSHSGNSTALSPTVSPNHSHKGRISPRPLSIPSPVPSNHSSGASPSPHSLPATPTSASSSVSLSLFDIHGTSDASQRLWGSPGAATAHSSAGGGAGSVDDSALHHTVGWNAPKSVPVVKNHHRRSVTMNDAFHASSAFSSHGQLYAAGGAPFPLPPKAPLALHIPATAASSASPSVLSSSSASPSHLVPRNLFSTTSSLTASQVTSPTGRQAGGGRLLEEMRRMDGDRVDDDGAMVNSSSSSGGGGGSGGQLGDVDGSLLRQLEGVLACPFSLTSCSTRPHLLHQPVLMPCCGVAVCGGCASLYVTCNDEQSCSCGQRYNDWERQQLNALPTQRLLAQLTAVISDTKEIRG